MSQKVLITCIVLLFAYSCLGDMYLQAVRGSNNRLDERGRNRNNGNRMFDSQNNNRGGYNVGKMTYFEGEKIPISWTNQHGSGKYQMGGTEIILQYACGARLRDGTTTRRIPDKPKDCQNYDCDTDVRFGRHESYESYQSCKATSRNQGLFTANQNLKGTAAIYTRQNSNGARRGYECPEERDYYPYWRASMWKDAAVITNDVERCKAVQAESQNVKDRYECKLSEQFIEQKLKGRAAKKGSIPITEAACKSLGTVEIPGVNGTTNTTAAATWTKIPAFGIAAPACIQSETTRSNHLGLIGGKDLYTMEWTVPKEANDACVIRARYNITTTDYSAWKTPAGLEAGLDSAANGCKISTNKNKCSKPNPNQDPANFTLWEKFNLTRDDVKANLEDRNRNNNAQQNARGYVFVNNPRVDPFGIQFNQGNTQKRVQLQLAVNTNQFGRTFQDRTHTFAIKPRPTDVPVGANIQLITVQGKRGNIVQVFPGTEYFFSPDTAKIRVGDYMHFCWTGSNTNPNNNDGQGLRGTDRSNVCPLTDPKYSKALYSNVEGNTAAAEGDSGNSYPNFVAPPIGYELPTGKKIVSNGMCGLDTATLKALCTTRRDDQARISDYGNMEELDDRGTTVCIDPIQASKTGSFNYVSTRNNNFSNRSQKGSITCGASEYVIRTVGFNGGTFSAPKTAAALEIPNGAIKKDEAIRFEMVSTENRGGTSEIVELKNLDSKKMISQDKSRLWMPYQPNSLSKPHMYYSKDGKSWSEVSTASFEKKDGKFMAASSVAGNGFYKVENEVDAGAVAAISIGILLFAAAICIAGCYKCRPNSGNQPQVHSPVMA